MKFIKLVLCTIILFVYPVAIQAQISYELSVEQTVVQNKLEISIFIENTGVPFILGTSMLRLNVDTSGLDLTNTPFEIEEGQWYNNFDPTNYFDQFTGRSKSSGWVSVNIDHSVSLDGSEVSSSSTLVGKIFIPITDPTEYSGVSWRLSDLNSNTAVFDIDFNDITSNGEFINPSNAPLPVELTTFVTSVRGRDIFLNWITVTEFNASHFEVERKIAKNSEWEKIATIRANGNSNILREYSFTDKKLNSGLYDYRLKLVDNDGSYNYSKSVSAEIKIPEYFSLSQNYPNPFNPFTTIEFQIPQAGNVELNIYNSIGEKIIVLYKGILDGGIHSLEWNGKDLNGNEVPSGVYFYEMLYSAEKLYKTTKKMLHIK